MAHVTTGLLQAFMPTKHPNYHHTILRLPCSTLLLMIICLLTYPSYTDGPAPLFIRIFVLLVVVTILEY